MKVKMLTYTKNAVDVIARATNGCQKDHVPDEWVNSMSEEDFIRELRQKKHDGAFEHCYFTFNVSGCSRNLSHQLVRHRIASYLQQSNRKVIPKQEAYVVPPSMKDHLAEYEQAMENQWAIYEGLISNGVPIEDARFLLPSGYMTHITVTMNVRSLCHLFELRLDEHAQWEIRKMANLVLKEVKKIYPVFFEDYRYEVPKEVSSYL